MKSITMLINVVNSDDFNDENDDDDDDDDLDKNHEGSFLPTVFSTS